MTAEFVKEACAQIVDETVFAKVFLEQGDVEDALEAARHVRVQAEMLEARIAVLTPEEARAGSICNRHTHPLP